MAMVTDAELATLQADMARTFTSSAVIKRPEFGSDELGDDAVDTNPTTIGTVSGALSSAPSATAGLDGSMLATVNTYRWNCPVNSDIQPRDRLVIGANEYVVTDTTKDESLPLCLSVSLRLRE